MEKTPEASRQLIKGEVALRIEQDPSTAASGVATPEQSSVTFHVQVASFSVPENAKELQEKLSAAFNVPATVHNNKTTGMTQVRLGEFFRREDARQLLDDLMVSGYSDAFIVSDMAAAGRGAGRLALRGPDNLFRLSVTGFLFLPSSAEGFISVDGKPYRGSFDVWLNNRERITVVNQLAMEEYLPGVVPAELSPVLYPEFAALAAQTIAARTYALKNMGRYRAEGFDLTNDTRTQVYDGVSREHAVTNDIVRRTSGIAIYYQNNLIDAMYMSTCGGRTEDFAKVYDAPSVPYLQSVFCTIEGTFEKGEIIIDGSTQFIEPFTADNVSPANRNIVLAGVLGITGPGECCCPDFLTGSLERDEAVRWVENAARIAGKSSPGRPFPGEKGVTRSAFLLHAAESFFGADGIRKRISPNDMHYYTAHLKDGILTPEPVRYALSYLMQHGLWRPNPDNTVRPDAPILRGDAIALLVNWVEAARPGLLRRGTFREALRDNPGDPDTRIITARMGNTTQEFQISGNPYLFRIDAGQRTPVRSLRLIGAENIAFFVNRNGVIEIIEAELNPTGAASDRFSSAAVWNTRILRSSADEKLRSLAGDIGSLRDIRPHRIGDSGRAVRIEVIGSRKSAVINGYRVRNALGLKDTLFTITREYGPDGNVATFIFSGRGWGHGVGLCQVGAFGMARAGRSAVEILKTY
ncbi:MAG TPA: SpoIID/LytB domain-containing protein, partial [Acidobacteriota bacterium]|nr:SpoIID/LytB domain-containing protein [Acidobacteriota bacterium]